MRPGPTDTPGTLIRPWVIETLGHRNRHVQGQTQSCTRTQLTWIHRQVYPGQEDTHAHTHSLSLKYGYRCSDTSTQSETLGWGHSVTHTATDTADEPGHRDPVTWMQIRSKLQIPSHRYSQTHKDRSPPGPPTGQQVSRGSQLTDTHRQTSQTRTQHQVWMQKQIRTPRDTHTCRSSERDPHADTQTRPQRQKHCHPFLQPSSGNQPLPPMLPSPSSSSHPPIHPPSLPPLSLH